MSKTIVNLELFFNLFNEECIFKTLMKLQKDYKFFYTKKKIVLCFFILVRLCFFIIYFFFLKNYSLYKSIQQVA